MIHHYAVMGLICICPPIALSTFMMVAISNFEVSIPILYPAIPLLYLAVSLRRDFSGALLRQGHGEEAVKPHILIMCL